MRPRVFFLVFCSLLWTACKTDFEESDDRDKDEEVLYPSDGCVITSSQAIGWAEVSSIGVSPESVFSILEGSCEAPFNWDGQIWSDEVTIDPISGSSSVNVTVELDKQSALLIEREEIEGAMSICRPSLEISAHVTLITTGGTLSEDRQLSIVYGHNSYKNLDGQISITWSVTPQELDGLLNIATTNENTELYLGFRIEPIEIECTGSIHLTVEKRTGRKGVAESRGDIATWSNSD